MLIYASADHSGEVARNPITLLPNKERIQKSVEHGCYTQPVIMPAVPHEIYPNKEGNGKTVERLRSRTTLPRGCVANATLHHRSIELSQVGKKRERCRTLGSQIKLTCISCNSRSSQRMICCTIRASTLIPSRKETKKRRTRGSRPQLPCNSRLSQVGKKWKKCRTLVHK